MKEKRKAPPSKKVFRNFEFSIGLTRLFFFGILLYALNGMAKMLSTAQFDIRLYIVPVVFLIFTILIVDYLLISIINNITTKEVVVEFRIYYGLFFVCWYNVSHFCIHYVEWIDKSGEVHIYQAPVLYLYEAVPHKNRIRYSLAVV